MAAPTGSCAVSGSNPQEELASARSAEELGLLAAISAHAGALPSETATLLQRTIRFGEKHAGEAMTPRIDVIGLAATARIAKLLTAAQNSGHSRFPIYIDTVDQVVGVVSVIDTFAVPAHRRQAVSTSIGHAEPVFVPGSLDLSQALNG